MDRQADATGAAPAGGGSLAVVAAALLGALAAAPLASLIAEDQLLGASVELAAWPPLAVVAALVLDRHPNGPLGFVCGALSLTGLLLIAVAVLRPGDLTPRTLSDTVAQLGPWPAILTGLIMLIAFRAGHDRDGRRRRLWVGIAFVAILVATVVAWQTRPDGQAALVSAVAVWLITGVAGAVALSQHLRPVDEPLLDVALVLAVLAAAAGAGLLVLAGGRIVGQARADLLGAIGAVTAAALAVPCALWLRRALVARRYGRGVLLPADVAAITADLGADADPRPLLGKAAAMVSAASGNPEVQIQLGEEVEAPSDWDQYALVVAEQRVGTLLVRARQADELEARQRRAVAQLVPVVSLVARAVTLAVEAQHARQDVAREREAERRRMLTNLHDDLGPVIAGMAMRIQARRQTAAEPWLDDLAHDLAACRADLRRIVSGLSPAALEEHDLRSALDRMLNGYQPQPGGPEVCLIGVVPDTLPRPVAATVYRTVAEGVTNAVRHGRASRVTVRVECRGDYLDTEVVDDGVGGPIVDGTGISSLRHRAQELGGSLEVGPTVTGGTRLALHVPIGVA